MIEQNKDMCTLIGAREKAFLNSVSSSFLICKPSIPKKLLLSHYEKGKAQAIRVLKNHIFNKIKNMQEKSAFNVMKLSVAPEVMTKRGSRSTYSILHIIIVCIINNSYRTYIKQWCMLTKGSSNKAHMTSLKEPSSQRLLQ
jgi:hypothetical protein